MSKDAVTDWDTTAANNADIGGISLAEGVMAYNDVNDALRAIMSQLATFITDADFTLATTTSARGVTATTPAAFAFDCAANNFFRKTCTGSHTISFTNVPAGSWAGIIELTNGGLGTLTLPSGSTWAGGAAPTLSSSGIDLIGVFTVDGGTSWRWILIALAVS